jgi:small acid-soluble spore protein E (minor gamma-type SASP)
MGRKNATWAQYFLGGDRMSKNYKTDPAHARKQNAQSQKAGAAGYQTEFASESATNAQQVQAQNAASANASASNSAAGYQTEFASESATNAQQVRQQNAQSQRAKASNSAAGYQTEFASESATNAQQVRQQNAQSQNKKNHQK